MKIPFFHQFRIPEGTLGKLAGFIMSKENKKLNRWAVGCLDLRNKDRILEIGYGPGYSMSKMLHGQAIVFVDGIDPSDVMAKQASKRIQPFIDTGRARVIQEKIEDMYLPQNHYDKILSVNNFTIWEDQSVALKKLYGSLKEDGRIVITIQPREEEASPNLTKMMAKEIYHALSEAGFNQITLSYRRIWPELSVCAVAFKKNVD